MGARVLAIALSIGGEPAHLTLDAPPCATIERLREELDALGARANSHDGRDVRSFEVHIEPNVPDEPGFAVRLIVSDHERRQERVVPASTCSDATRAAALLISLALDEPPATPPAPSPPSLPSLPELSLWSAPAERPVPALRAPGSGGLAMLGSYGRSMFPEGGMHVAGIRALAVARVFRGTRVGGAFGFTSETERVRRDDTMLFRSNGWSARAGAVVAWGAPWNDSVVGYAGEVGVAVGRQTGSAAKRSATGGDCTIDFNLDAACYDAARATGRSVTFVSPYFASTLVLQVPWRAPIRPIAALGAIARAGTADALQLGFTGELGLAWQAW